MTQHLAETQAAFDHEPPKPSPPPFEPSATPQPDPIRIYVACLAAYNNGHLHGEWVEVTDEATSHVVCVPDRRGRGMGDSRL